MLECFRLRCRDLHVYYCINTVPVRSKVEPLLKLCLSVLSKRLASVVIPTDAEEEHIHEVFVMALRSASSCVRRGVSTIDANIILAPVRSGVVTPQSLIGFDPCVTPIGAGHAWIPCAACGHLCRFVCLRSGDLSMTSKACAECHRKVQAPSVVTKSYRLTSALRIAFMLHRLFGMALHPAFGRLYEDILKFHVAPSR